MKKEDKIRIIERLSTNLSVTNSVNIEKDILHLCIDKRDLSLSRISARDLKIIVNTSTFTEMRAGNGFLIFIFNIADDPNVFG